MDEKTLTILEYPKVLDKLAGYAAFSASEELARTLRPVSDLETAQALLARTTEARFLLSVNDNMSVGGVRDVRQHAGRAARRGVLLASELLEVKNTLSAARDLARAFVGRGANSAVGTGSAPQNAEYPHLAAIAAQLFPPTGVIDAISCAIADSGEVMDQASPQLSAIRSELKVAHDRLLSRLERMINDPDRSSMLQESIITQRNGRYVIPLRAEFKGRIRGLIHDQSSSGATLFIEPVAVVELNNRWHELQLAERDEVQRILTSLSALVGENDAAIQMIIEALAELDLALMCARYADDLDASEPQLLPFRAETAKHPGSIVQLYQARHPLLPRERAVAVDIDLDDSTFAVVITGPNTGGKTVTLKTAGLLVLMAQSGLHIPAQSGSTFSIFNEVFADIGDEQSIEQSLSTFSGHIRNIARILKQSDSKTLVLLDELGSGTDPQEGAALARALLAHLIERRISCLVATHYAELKIFAHANSGVVNASMEFDIETLQPTYHLALGLPGRSNALLIAERLGLPLPVIQSARSSINPDDLQADDLLNDIYRQRDLARQARVEADKARREAEKIKAELTMRLEGVEDERTSLLGEARQQAVDELEELRQEMVELRRKLQRARLPMEELRAMEEETRSIQENVEEREERRLPLPQDLTPAPLIIGEKVWLRSIKMAGVLAAINGEDAEVQLGSLRMRAALSDLQRPGQRQEESAPAMPAARQRDKTPPPPAKAPTPAPALLHPSPGMELDLRGQRSEDALERLRHYLEDAYLAGMPFVRIIHGKGTGRLRESVRQALRHSEHITSWTTGKDNEGGDGVTVAFLSSD